MTLNSYLLAQTTVATIAAAPTGLPLGEWIAITALLLTIAGVVYKAGGASAKAQSTEKLVTKVLGELSGKMDKVLEEVQRERVEDARWKADIAGRVRVLEGDPPTYIHQRASDVR